MKNSKLRHSLVATSQLMLVLLLNLGVIIGDFAVAHADNRQSSSNKGTGNSNKPSHKISHELRGKAGANGVNVLLELNGNNVSRELNVFLKSNGVRVKKQLERFKTLVVELPADAVEELANYSDVKFVSLGKEVQSFGHVEVTTGAATMRN